MSHLNENEAKEEMGNVRCGNFIQCSTHIINIEYLQLFKHGSNKQYVCWKLKIPEYLILLKKN